MVPKIPCKLHCDHCHIARSTSTFVLHHSDVQCPSAALTKLLHVVIDESSENCWAAMAKAQAEGDTKGFV